MNGNRQMTMSFQLKVKRVWVHGFLLGLLLGTLGFCVYFFSPFISIVPPLDENAARSPSETQTPAAVPAEPKVSLQPTPSPDNSLEMQLVRVFETIKETTEKKDLARLLSLYSPNYPQLSEKAQTIKRSWKLFNYQKMAFKILEIKSTAEDSAVAWVTWEVAAKNLATHRIKNISKTYQVSLIKEDGQWHIIGLKNALW
jgi:hypothetical protein